MSRFDGGSVKTFEKKLHDIVKAIIHTVGYKTLLWSLRDVVDIIVYRLERSQK